MGDQAREARRFDYRYLWLILALVFIGYILFCLGQDSMKPRISEMASQVGKQFVKTASQPTAQTEVQVKDDFAVPYGKSKQLPGTDLTFRVEVNKKMISGVDCFVANSDGEEAELSFDMPANTGGPKDPLQSIRTKDGTAYVHFEGIEWEYDVMTGTKVTGKFAKFKVILVGPYVENADQKTQIANLQDQNGALEQQVTQLQNPDKKPVSNIEGFDVGWDEQIEPGGVPLTVGSSWKDNGKPKSGIFDPNMRIWVFRGDGKRIDVPNDFSWAKLDDTHDIRYCPDPNTMGVSYTYASRKSMNDNPRVALSVMTRAVEVRIHPSAKTN